MRLWPLGALLALYGCASIPRPPSLPPCGLSVAIEPDKTTGLRLPPPEIVGHVTCKLYARTPRHFQPEHLNGTAAVRLHHPDA